MPSFIDLQPASSIDGRASSANSEPGKKVVPLSTRYLRRAAILGVPIVPVAQEVIHVHHDVLVSDPHPAHLVLRTAFDRLLDLLSRIRSGWLPVLPDEVDKAVADGVGLQR